VKTAEIRREGQAPHGAAQSCEQGGGMISLDQYLDLVFLSSRQIG